MQTRWTKEEGVGVMERSDTATKSYSILTHKLRKTSKMRITTVR